MTLAFYEGDILVAGTKEYPVKRVEAWSMSRQSAASFAHMATLTVSFKRSAITGTLRGAAVALTGSYAALPLDPLDAELRKSIEPELDTPAKLLQTTVTDGSAFVRLIVEDLK